MGYRTDIRITTSEKGFEKLREFITKYLEEHKAPANYNLLDSCDIKQEGTEQVYFGWDDIKWYEDVFVEVAAIMEGLNYLEENEYSYRYMNIGESYDDIEVQYNDGEKDKNILLEYPRMIRKFDDEYILSSIKEKQEIEQTEQEPDICN